MTRRLVVAFIILFLLGGKNTMSVSRIFLATTASSFSSMMSFLNRVGPLSLHPGKTFFRTGLRIIVHLVIWVTITKSFTITDFCLRTESVLVILYFLDCQVTQKIVEDKNFFGHCTNTNFKMVSTASCIVEPRPQKFPVLSRNSRTSFPRNYFVYLVTKTLNLWRLWTAFKTWLRRCEQGFLWMKAMAGKNEVPEK